MTPEQSARIFAEIAVRTNGWDEASSEAWMRDIGRLEHTDIAATAARQLVDNHTDHGRPQWGSYLGLYRTLLARRINDTPALPDNRGYLTPVEYATRLRERVEAGLPSFRLGSHTDPSISAADELANWQRLIHGDGALDWHHVINRMEEP